MMGLMASSFKRIVKFLFSSSVDDAFDVSVNVQKKQKRNMKKKMVNIKKRDVVDGISRE